MNLDPKHAALAGYDAKAAPPGPPALNEEQVAPDEERHIQEAIALALDMMEKQRLKSGGVNRRALVTKHHGCVRAVVTPAIDRPAEARYGVFAGDAPFSAWIRFANAAPGVQPDSVGAGRGMAIKLLGVEGPKLLDAEAGETTQDFVLLNNPTFVVKDTEAHNALLRDGPGYLAAHPDTQRAIEAIRAKKIADPLEIRYWSMTPYRLGPRAVKLSAAPCGPAVTPYPAAPSDDYLAEAMERHLQEREGCFRLMVQFQRDAVRQPVEDPTVAWEEAESPFVTVATITVPKQTFRSPEQDAFCENLSFTPWHSLAEHRPLGNINRARRFIYEALSKARHAGNGVPRREPTGEEVFP